MAYNLFLPESLWPPCVADADIIFLPCGFFLSLTMFLMRTTPNQKLHITQHNLNSRQATQLLKHIAQILHGWYMPTLVYSKTSTQASACNDMNRQTDTRLMASFPGKPG